MIKIYFDKAMVIRVLLVYKLILKDMQDNNKF